MHISGSSVLQSAAVQQSQSAQHLPEDRHYYSIILSHCCQQAWPFPRACVSATRDKWAACSAFLLFSPASVYHLFSISFLYLPFFKSICGAEKYPLALGLCCWNWSVSVTCSRELARNSQPKRSSSQEVGFYKVPRLFFFLMISSSCLKIFQANPKLWGWLWRALLVRSQWSWMLWITELGMTPSFLHAPLLWILIRNSIDFN